MTKPSMALSELVEKGADGDFLRQRGCDVAQGFVLARPLQVTDATERLAQRSGSTAFVSAIAEYCGNVRKTNRLLRICCGAFTRPPRRKFRDYPKYTTDWRICVRICRKWSRARLACRYTFPLEFCPPPGLLPGARPAGTETQR